MKTERSNIRAKLAKYCLSQVWLKEELEENGIIATKTAINEVLKGHRRTGEKVEQIINGSLEILDSYENGFKNRKKNISTNCTNI